METTSAFVAIVGRPNVGKSSLMNQMLGEKVAIVSSKPQTTRTRITGVLTKDELQLVFIDTPGLHKPKTKLSEYMIDQIGQSVADVDVAVLVTEPTGPISAAEKQLMENFRAGHIPALLAINKIDTLDDKSVMMSKIAAFAQSFDFDEIIPLSALTGEGVSVLLNCLGNYAQQSPHFFEDDTLTDQTERVLMGEIIREKILNTMRDEIPHGVAVVIETMREREDKEIIDIEATILCERASHKGMIIGKQGAMLKTIASQAREDMERFLDIKVNLQCWVKVKEDWRNRENIIHSLGFN